MKDYSVIKETLNVLVEVQEQLITRLESANKTLIEECDESSRYTMDDEGNVLYTNEDGTLEDGRTKWDMEYATRRYKNAKRTVKAYQNILDYLDHYKL